VNPTGDIDGILSACGPGRRFQHMVMLPASVNLIAFDNRFVRICCSLQSGIEGAELKHHFHTSPALKYYTRL
jgi:hypothetical protein